MKKRTGKKKRILYQSLMLMLLLLLCCSCESEAIRNETTETAPVPASSQDQEKEDKNDPLSLSFTDSSLLFDSDLRNILSKSELEYCSHITGDPESTDLLLTWNLKSDNREVYRCEYSFDKQRGYAERSKTACHLSEAYDDYLHGDTVLIRDYVMPEKDDDIEMFVYENGSAYYEKYFILGKYSDMYCYTKGDDIFLEYYWYQDTDDGPVLVYKSTAEGTKTTAGQRYSEYLWVLFEESVKNIRIIPYSEYPREKDYFEVYREWKNKDRQKKDEEHLKEKKDIYCKCADENELYSEYEDEFDSWEDAADFFEEYCE